MNFATHYVSSKHYKLIVGILVVSSLLPEDFSQLCIHLSLISDSDSDSLAPCDHKGEQETDSGAGQGHAQRLECGTAAVSRSLATSAAAFADPA